MGELVGEDRELLGLGLDDLGLAFEEVGLGGIAGGVSEFAFADADGFERADHVGK